MKSCDTSFVDALATESRADIAAWAMHFHRVLLLDSH